MIPERKTCPVSGKAEPTCFCVRCSSRKITHFSYIRHIAVKTRIGEAREIAKSSGSRRGAK